MTIPAFWQETWTAAMVNHLWQSTVVAGVAWLLALALRRNQARARYWVWMIASVKFLVPFALLIDAGQWLRSLSAAPPAAQPALAAVMQQITQPFPQGQSFDFAGPVVAAHRADLLPVVLLAIWACGASMVLFRWVRGWRRIRAAVRAARPLKLAAHVPALSTSALLEPGVFGIFRPVLLLPEGILNRLTPAQLDAIVAHEMCHVRRRDNLTFAVHMIVEALFWFYPPVWWMGARLIEERERACDEAVLASGNGAEAYAEGILNVCKHYVESPLACVSGVSGSDLKKRIVQIMAEQVAHKLDLRRKLLLGFVAVLAAALPVGLGLVHAAEGQVQTAAKETGIVGTWQGTLHVPQHDMRLVVKIAQTDAGALKADFYSIDENGRPLPVTSITLDGTTVKIDLNAIGGNFEGKLSADGNSIDGAWSQGRNRIPLVLARATPATEWTIPTPPRIQPMAADANPSFEVATIKPNNSGVPHLLGLKVHGRIFTTNNTSVEDLITFAYGVQTKQIVNGPGWIGTERYDVEGIPDAPGTPSIQQLRVMVQKLLADRFKLTFHQEKRKLSAYVLTVAKGGEKLTPTDPKEPLPGLGFIPGKGGLTMRVINATMPDFTSFLQELVLDRPVVDRTGLTGRYDFQCLFAPDDSQFGGHPPGMPPAAAGGGAAAAPAAETASAPDLYEAMQQQLGLKLSAEKTGVDVIAIDHVDHPSPN